MHDNKSSIIQTSARRRATVLVSVTALAGLVLPQAVWAQKYPITGQQRSTAQQVAARGVPLSELAPNAPDTYVVKRGDTLWAISGLYLKRPWRWPELWGMNLQAIRNPHLIYPGQTLYLEKSGGYARLRTGGPNETVRVSPRTRYESLSDNALPTLQPHLIEPFLVEPEVVDELTLAQVPRVVAMRGDHSIASNGDRVYVRGPDGHPLQMDADTPRRWRVFRNAVPMKDPVTGEILGYEAQYVSRAALVRGETTVEVPDGDDKVTLDIVPATVEISGVKEEVRPGDRLLPAAKRSFLNYVPRAPQAPVEARVVSLYGSMSVTYAGQNQVVAINRGSRDGLEVGHVLTVLRGGERVKDKTDEQRPMMTLPSEVSGNAMVFRTFDRVSYVLLLRVDDAVRVGDRLVSPE